MEELLEQWKPLNVITLRSSICDRMITKTDCFCSGSDNNKQLITLTVIMLSGILELNTIWLGIVKKSLIFIVLKNDIFFASSAFFISNSIEAII